MARVVLLSAALFLSLSHLPAQAQERQVFSPYPQPTFMNDPSGAAAGQAMSNRYQGQSNGYMIYPGREQYGQNFGYIPRHPGDYRDAVDRGQWTGGGGAVMPRRSFNGY